ncbi:MAG: FIG004436: Protein related to deoxyribodipyrimidine photolyase [uncultured Paraburkholderia sp.]|nr:MAG: FIG004436: Protein related to deoxyribodipyrimidine photolyase [uncultured Paraburkholderia sp.]
MRGNDFATVLGDQLNARHSWWCEQRDDVLYLMMEIRSETDYAHHHAQKVLAPFACMRGFGAALGAAGHQLRYFRIDDSDNGQTFAANLRSVAQAVGTTALERMEADEWRVEQALDAAAVECGLEQTVVTSEHFLVERGELKAAFESSVPRMEFFYRDLRKRFDILLMAEGEPEGGHWNYDVENRAKWPGTPQAPVWRWQAHDLSELWREIQAAGVKTMGEPNASQLKWPLTRREAREGLALFVREALPHFGTYQDALSSRSLTLFHSLLSFSLNVKMLHPLEVIKAALGAYKQTRRG